MAPRGLRREKRRATTRTHGLTDPSPETPPAIPLAIRDTLAPRLACLSRRAEEAGLTAARDLLRAVRDALPPDRTPDRTPEKQ
ncbi:hypothetical protein ACE7GA_08205 [Roseomonas sp. CCTCC AB2023176]|uniref:hypothetical protein n=1 Tax=Roseomonas sp. CCTCC AB2023176 TaxID=3342640 RepID=UPI0035D7B027